MTSQMQAILKAAERYSRTLGMFPDDKTLLEASGAYSYWDGSALEPQYQYGSFQRDCLELVKLGHFGMVGFKYCWPELARADRRAA